MSKRITCLVLVCVLVISLTVAAAAAEESTSANEQEIYLFLTGEMGLNTAAACGIMGNIYCETGFRADISVGSYYGLFMYYAPLANSLRSWCEQNSQDYTTVKGQMEFFRAMCDGEVKYFDYTDLYSDLLEIENTSDGAYNAGYTFCTQFEKPANMSYEANRRGLYASGTLFEKYYGTETKTSASADYEGEETTVESNYTGTVCTGILNVRSGPGTKYSILTTLTRGTQVTVTEEAYDFYGTGWAKVEEGWICSTYLTKDDEVAVEEAAETVGTYTVFASALNVRSGPGLDRPVINCISKGTVISVTEEFSSGGMMWCKLTTGGWVCKNYLTAVNTVSSYKVTASSLNVRSGCGLSYEVVDSYRRGTEVTVVDTASASDGTTWAKLTTGNWVCMTYLTAA